MFVEFFGRSSARLGVQICPSLFGEGWGGNIFGREGVAKFILQTYAKAHVVENVRTFEAKSRFGGNKNTGRAPITRVR